MEAIQSFIWLRGMAPAGTVALTLDGEPVALDPSGHFIVAFDRDAGPRAELVAEHEVHAPTWVIVGEVVQLREKLAWFEGAQASL